MAGRNNEGGRIKMIAAPKFIESPYFVPEVDNWHLKEGAPDDIKKEFDEYMKDKKQAELEGKIL